MPDDKCTAVRYKIKAAGVHPASMRSHFHFGNMARTEHCNCVLGLSLNNEQFSLPKLQSMAAWIDQRFRKCRILVGDTIYRLTLQIKEHLDEGRSLEKARQIGSATIEQIRHMDLICSFYPIITGKQSSLHPYWSPSHRWTVASSPIIGSP